MKCLSIVGTGSQNFTKIKTIEGNREAMDIDDLGKIFMAPTVYLNRKEIRASFVNWRTTAGDIQIVIKEMKEVLALI